MIREGKIWVEEAAYRILRIETTADSLPGETRFQTECTRYHLTPRYTVRHNYDVERNGLLYPGRSEIRLDYSGLVNPPKDVKARIRIRYDRYRFFSVETEEHIIKSIRLPGLKRGVYPGLKLSGALYPDFKIGILRRERIK